MIPLRPADFHTDPLLGRGLANLGGFCWRHAPEVILLWFVFVLIAAAFTGNLTQRLRSGAGDIPGSASERVDKLLVSEFGRGEAQNLILVFRSDSLDRRPTDLTALFNNLQHRLAIAATLKSTVSERELPDERLIPKSGAGHFILIDPGTVSLEATEAQVPKIRATVLPILEKAKSQHRDLEWALTGRAALTDDLNRFDAEDAARAEMRALPFSLVILIVAFGSIMSALLPVIIALASRMVVLAIIFALAGSMDVVNLVISVVTMLSISLGIDYSLFIVHRYRRELLANSDDVARHGGSVGEEAIRRAMTQSGSAVFFSAIIVAIGIGSLLATPLMQTRSIGIGGVIAVLVTVSAALTLIPATLRVVGPDGLEWPAFISSHRSGEHSRRLWRWWARVVQRAPIVTIAASLGLLLLMAAPALHTRIGFPESQFLPAELEFSKGLAMLDRMELKGLLSPIVVVVSDVKGGPALTADRRQQLTDFTSRLEQERSVRFVQGPLTQGDAEDADRSISDAVGSALQRSEFINRDRSRLLFLLVPSGDATLTEMRDLSRRIPTLSGSNGLSVEVGGQAQYYNDYDKAVRASFLRTVVMILGMSALALLLVFRAPLASAKAIVLNLLSVSAGYGVVVLVFQLGYGSSFLGVPAATEVVPITVPLLIFCFLFGLSMDYEIFLLSRVRAIFDESRDNALSIEEGLADTGSVITSAALIMVAVFGAFAFARDVVVQMIGLGLATAVFVDATVIRSALGPALMLVAGRWNWWPGAFAVPRRGN